MFVEGRLAAGALRDLEAAGRLIAALAEAAALDSEARESIVARPDGHVLVVADPGHRDPFARADQQRLLERTAEEAAALVVERDASVLAARPRLLCLLAAAHEQHAQRHSDLDAHDRPPQRVIQHASCQHEAAILRAFLASRLLPRAPQVLRQLRVTLAGLST